MPACGKYKVVMGLKTTNARCLALCSIHLDISNIFGNYFLQGGQGLGRGGVPNKGPKLPDFTDFMHLMTILGRRSATPLQVTSTHLMFHFLGSLNYTS